MRIFIGLVVLLSSTVSSAAVFNCVSDRILTVVNTDSDSIKVFTVNAEGNRALEGESRVVSLDVQNLEDMATKYVVTLSSDRQLSVTFPVGVHLAVGHYRHTTLEPGAGMPHACELVDH